MKNIITYLKSVNTETLKDNKKKNLIFQVASEILYLDSPMKENFTECKSSFGFNYHIIKNPNKTPAQNYCSRGMPFTLAECPHPKEVKTRKNKDKEKLYPEAFENSTHIKLFKRALRATLVRFCNQWGVTGYEINGNWTFMQSNSKGTVRYYTKQYWRFHDVCKELDKHYRYHFFDTVTCDPHMFSRDLIIRYKQFSDRIGKYCRYMSRFIKGKCVCVIESTGSGLPHAHIVYYTNNPFLDSKERHKKGTKYNYIYDGSLKNQSFKWWGLGYCELRKDAKGETANYLSKYLSKSTKEDIKKLIKKEHWSKSDWKTVLTVLLPVLAKVRQFRLSQLNNLPSINETQKEECLSCPNNETCTEIISPPPAEDSVTDSARLRAYLKALCINSPIPCIKNVVIAQLHAFSKDFGDDFDKINQKSQKEKEKIAKKCTPLSCGGCPIARIIKNVLFGDDFYTENVDETKYFGSYVYLKWLGEYNAQRDKKEWLNNPKEQDFFIGKLFNKIVKECGGVVSTGSLNLMCETHHSLWYSILPKEVLPFASDLIIFYKKDYIDILEKYNLYESFLKTFMLFIHRLQEPRILESEKK